jgi:pyridoxine 5-phosphate synthase
VFRGKAKKKMPKLGVNIDHVATLREARKTYEPDPVLAAKICEDAGCDSIVCHLREDRRHIKDADLLKLRESVRTRLNLEMSVAKEIVGIACRIKPEQATLVPEKRREITTEGGLDVVRGKKRIRDVIARLRGRGIATSLFIDPKIEQVEASKNSGAKIVEFHTGEYANAKTAREAQKRLRELKAALQHAVSLGMEVNAGHGLNYRNVKAVASLEGINELNIGHSIISRAVFVGLSQAVKEMLRLTR